MEADPDSPQGPPFSRANPRLECHPRASRAPSGERAELARSFPARKEVLVKLHELDCRRHSLFLAVQLENCITADDFLGFDERTIENAELPIYNSHLRSLGNRR